MSTADRRPPPRHTPPVFELTGGRLVLDFANTVDNRPVVRRKDLLHGYADLVAWGRQTGVVGERAARGLLRTAQRHPTQARAALRRAKVFREALYRIFAGLAAGTEPARADLAALERLARDTWGVARLVRSGAGFVSQWIGDPVALDRVLWPVARDAVDLLVAGEVRQLRVCRAGDCGWLFLDRSRNQSRVWCDMRVCGNRAKARRHYARSRKARVAS